MKSYTFSDLNRQSGEILDSAMLAPVALTKRGKEKLFIVPAKLFRQLSAGRVQAYTVENAPDDINAELLAGLDDLITPDNGDA
jgi:prevent-host-death family protein